MRYSTSGSWALGAPHAEGRPALSRRQAQSRAPREFPTELSPATSCCIVAAWSVQPHVALLFNDGIALYSYSIAAL